MKLAISLLCAGGVIMLSTSIGWYVFWSRVFQNLDKEFEKSEREERKYELLELGKHDEK